ncbi:EF-hand domain-containing protein [Sphingomonas sp. CFBP 13720]|uniref:EF-hand domain-containing protein n=1 Tax=Sphingomonas sp. CFBP 13720 TaxID=2775302 RepID=UPI00177D84AD|nr:EF-hand domain-containing protein [Sphingomonas sp. CFBP 13720]MBD8677260.1 EF-hand domain-containing protein [Sphingomonas sp. CFBP 13720]
MMKRILLASAVLMSTPAFAQDAAPAQTTVAPAQTVPGAPATTAPEEASDVIGATPAAPATQPDPATQTAQTTAEAGQPATGTQIAQIVEAEFPKYDKDGKGQLTERQFGEWMVALRSASEPEVTADKPEVKAWVKQAFASADADKSKAVSKAELTQFLSRSA